MAESNFVKVHYLSGSCAIIQKATVKVFSIPDGYYVYDADDKAYWEGMDFHGIREISKQEYWRLCAELGVSSQAPLDAATVPRETIMIKDRLANADVPADVPDLELEHIVIESTPE